MESPLILQPHYVIQAATVSQVLLSPCREIAGSKEKKAKRETEENLESSELRDRWYGILLSVIFV